MPEGNSLNFKTFFSITKYDQHYDHPENELLHQHRWISQSTIFSFTFVSPLRSYNNNIFHYLNLLLILIEFRWFIGPCPLPKFGLEPIDWLTYLIPNSQDFFKGFPHDKSVAIALDKVQPVPCVFLVLIFLFLKILISSLFKKTSLYILIFYDHLSTKIFLAPNLSKTLAAYIISSKLLIFVFVSISASGIFGVIK